MTAIYRGFDRAALDREYSPSSRVGGDIEPYLRRYAELSEQARAQPGARPGLAYGEHPDEVLDLFLPQDDGPWPLHVFIHGGYWQALSQRDSGFMAPMFQSQGVACAALNYTLAPAASIGEMIGQCRRALAWLYRHAAKLGIDRARIAVSGHSAGAHLLAMLLATDWTRLGLPADLIKGALLISGIYDLEPIRLSYVDAPLGLTAQQVAAWSPQYLEMHVRCPVAVVWGANETDEFKRQSRAFAARLAAAGLPVEAREYAGLNHFDIVLELCRTESELSRWALAR
ncbi:MAG TPA: alpha/beta hydrolase [Candidatus Competibacteraceae bacterium]|nr:alpha/beta hydrolase [Candidatus Competibacteraceae bacterium]